MRSRTLSPCLLLLAVAPACGDDHAATVADAAPDAPRVDAALADAATAPSCTEAAVELAIGAEGGELTLCGARLVVPAGLLTEAVTFGIAPADVPAPALPRELAGPAVRFTPDDAPLPGAVEIALPHGGGGGRIELFVFDQGELHGIEACEVDVATVRQSVGLLGTFVATRDAHPYPDGPESLGTGTLTTHLGDRTDTWTLPADGFAIDEAYDDSVALTAILTRTPEPRGFEQMKIVVRVADGAAELLFVQWYVAGQGKIWQLGTPGAPGTTGVISLTEIDGSHLVGELGGTLSAGEATLALTATFDLTAGFYRYPPERFCGGGPEG